jgi:hypothetical protein
MAMRKEKSEALESSRNQNRRGWSLPRRATSLIPTESNRDDYAFAKPQLRRLCYGVIQGEGFGEWLTTTKKEPTRIG